VEKPIEAPGASSIKKKVNSQGRIMCGERGKKNIGGEEKATQTLKKTSKKWGITAGEGNLEKGAYQGRNMVWGSLNSTCW